MHPILSIVIPVYKSAGSLDELAHRLTASLIEITENYEILLVDDGSPDQSWEIIQKIQIQYPKITAIKLSRNFGQHSAMKAAIDLSSGDWVVIMDCDLQDRPEEIIKLYLKAMEGYDVVLGQRSNRQDSFIKKIQSQFFYLILNYLTDLNFNSSTSNFGIYNKKVIDALKKMPEKLPWYPGMILWIGFKRATVEVLHSFRKTGESSYNLRKLIHLGMNIIFSSTNKPLIITIKIGFFISFVSFTFGVLIGIRKIFGSSVPPLGWTSLIISIWFLFGLIILNMGILGLYISRIFNEAVSRPVYIIDEILDFKK